MFIIQILIKILFLLKNVQTNKEFQQANVCNLNECIFGTCEILSSYSYQCHCNQGITGKNCNQRIPVNNLNNLCLTNPCYNNSTCILSNNNNGQFTCNCNSNLNGGLLCKGTLNSCQCQNGGTCIPINTNSLPISYECTCPSGVGLLSFLLFFLILLLK